MKIAALSVSAILTLSLLSLLGCKSKDQQCLEGCDKTFATHNDGCASPTQPNPDRCRIHAEESRWLCRQTCGVSEPKPAGLEAKSEPAPEARSSPRETPAAGPRARAPFAQELDKVCEGTAESMAAAYAGTGGAHNAALVFYKDPDADRFIAQTLGDDYKDLDVQKKERGLPRVDAYALVVCVAVKEHHKVKSCAYKPKHTLELHDATFDIRVLEARTAKELASETVSVKHSVKQCPASWSFADERATSLPAFSDAVIEVAKKHVAP